MATSSEIMSDAIANNWSQDDLLAMASDAVGTADWQQYILAAQNIDYVTSGEEFTNWSDEHWNTWFADTGLDQTGYDWLGHYTDIMEEGGITAYTTSLEMTEIMNAIDVRLDPEKYDNGGFNPITAIAETVRAGEDIIEGVMAEGLEASFTFPIESTEWVLEQVGLEDEAQILDRLADNIDDAFDMLTEGVVDIEKYLEYGLFGLQDLSYFETGAENIEPFLEQLGITWDEFREDVTEYFTPEEEGGGGTTTPTIDFTGSGDYFYQPERYGRRETIYSELPKTFEEKTFADDTREATSINNIVGNTLI